MIPLMRPLHLTVGWGSLEPIVLPTSTLLFVENDSPIPGGDLVPTHIRFGILLFSSVESPLRVALMIPKLSLLKGQGEGWRTDLCGDAFRVNQRQEGVLSLYTNHINLMMAGEERTPRPARVLTGRKQSRHYPASHFYSPSRSEVRSVRNFHRPWGPQVI